ncbi:AAA-domain-containing protein [Xylariaceae sp. FL0804]|nr:AAA-domain-containing protein [Xylariaceae sp. FL0804]
MWPNRNVPSLQKTYDESYLKCSTAVYYESQGDEKEAMQCWKNALDQIRLNPANKKLSSYTPRSETERTLLESLRELEVQCQERIDLLEALRLSREDPTLRGPMTTSAANEDEGEGASRVSTPGKGFIGDGTIPAITYPELSKPQLPKRPSFPSRTSSERAVVSGFGGLYDQEPSSASSKPHPLLPYGRSTSNHTAARSSSPDKRTMRTTLRSGKSDKSARTSRPTLAKIAKGPGANKAATLAWSSVGSKGKPEHSLSIDSSVASTSTPVGKRSFDQAQRTSTPQRGHWDSHTRRLVATPDGAHAATPDAPSSPESPAGRVSVEHIPPGPSSLALGAASSALGSLSVQDTREPSSGAKPVPPPRVRRSSVHDESSSAGYSGSGTKKSSAARRSEVKRAPVGRGRALEANSAKKRVDRQRSDPDQSGGSISSSEDDTQNSAHRRRLKGKQKESPIAVEAESEPSEDSRAEDKKTKSEWERRKKRILRNLPPGVDDAAAKAIFNEIVVQGDEVHWSDVAGLEIAKNALREAVVYPFLRPDLFMGLREPARGMLLFGPPGTGKTMLARAVATESRSTFFSISASSLTSKYLGESEKLVRALFALAKVTAPSIIFVDEIDSLLSQRSGSGEHEATRRIKTEFLIQWSDLQRAAAGRESSHGSSSPGGRNGGGGGGGGGDPNRVLVLAATNLPWAIDEAARRRFVRRQYIPLPESDTRAAQLQTLLGQQKHSLTDADIDELVGLTDGFSGSDITALAKDAAMGPLRSLGEALLHMTMDQIRPIELGDFRASLRTIRPSVSQEGLREYEDWARQFGERGG